MADGVLSNSFVSAHGDMHLHWLTILVVLIGVGALRGEVWKVSGPESSRLDLLHLISLFQILTLYLVADR